MKTNNKIDFGRALPKRMSPSRITGKLLRQTYFQVRTIENCEKCIILYFFQTTFSVWVFSAPEQKGVSYWKFSESHCQTWERQKKILVVIVVVPLTSKAN